MRKRRRTGGFSSLLGVFFVMLFGVLAISFAGMSNMNVQMARSHRDITAAEAAAESGLAYTHTMIARYIAGSKKTFTQQVSETDALGTFDTLHSYLQASLWPGVFAEGGSVSPITTIYDGARTGQKATVGPLQFAGSQRATCTLELRQWLDDPCSVEVISTGLQAEVNRRVYVRYQMIKDTNLLKFAVASKSPIRITDVTTVADGIYSDWSDASIAPPITLAGIANVTGDVNTILKQEDFTAAGYNLEDLLEGAYEELNYDQPQLDLPTAADFDTQAYYKDTKTLSSGHTYNQKEYYPHAEGSYTTPVTGSTELNRTVYENMTIVDRRAISGNALFRNCVFEGIFYIGNSDGIGTNNVRFEGCTFNGPIVTGVPPKFGAEDWKKNCLYFTGDNRFNNTVLDEATILAPNYNVDIGNTDSTTTITGLIAGGVVDIRGNATVEGTILSMADPLELGELAGLIDTNVGISDAGVHTIDVTPRPGSHLPAGMASRVLLLRQGNTYLEM